MRWMYVVDVSFNPPISQSAGQRVCRPGPKNLVFSWSKLVTRDFRYRLILATERTEIN